MIKNINIQKSNGGLCLETTLEINGSWDNYNDYTKNIDYHGLIHAIKDSFILDEIIGEVENNIYQVFSKIIDEDWLDKRGLIKEENIEIEDNGYEYILNKGFGEYEVIVKDKDGHNIVEEWVAV